MVDWEWSMGGGRMSVAMVFVKYGVSKSRAVFSVSPHRVATFRRLHSVVLFGRTVTARVRAHHSQHPWTEA
jgi:hypothetical protein